MRSKVKVYDISGKLLQIIPKAFVNENFIDVSSYKAGVYIIAIDGVSYKFIKK